MYSEPLEGKTSDDSFSFEEAYKRSTNGKEGEMEGNNPLQDAGPFAIRVENLSKRYEIYDTPRDRLKQFIFPRLQRLLGREPKQYYREFWALKDVSFEVKRGETVGVIGRNGSGKSTLLQIICGTLAPTSGEVETQGRIAALLELGSGFNPEFTGRENVYMNASVLGLTKAEIDAKYNDILAFADIGEFIDQPVKQYSSGMYVRLAFAVIANVNANVLVIDEALAVGDIFFTQKCMRFLRGFTEKGALIFVSHDSSAIVGLCSKALLLQEGLIQCIGNPKEVTDFYLASLHEGPAETNLSLVKQAENEYVADAQRNMEFGTGAVRISSVQLTDEAGLSLLSMLGGEWVRLTIECLPLIDLTSPIVGFLVRDRLGQIVFGMNSLHAKKGRLDKFTKNRPVRVTFSFYMPTLQLGDYSLGVAVAEGSQLSHVQHHWIHDALILSFRPIKNVSGIVGVDLELVEAR